MKPNLAGIIRSGISAEAVVCVWIRPLRLASQNQGFLHNKLAQKIEGTFTPEMIFLPR